MKTKMHQSREFSFGNGSVANAYDNVLAPILFEPWAHRLVEDYQPWKNRRVLDLATGTGVVAQLLARRVGPGGRVFGADINSQMLDVARKRCADSTQTLEFIECPAHLLDFPDGSIDVVVCQQGFQFFPEKRAAAREAYRVLCDGGRLIATTWRPVAECEFFGSICSALDAIGEPGIAETMRVPFDVMDESELMADLEVAGFVNVELGRQVQDLVIDGGLKSAVEVAYSTPIGPKLLALPEQLQAWFREALTDDLDQLSPDGVTMGRMVSSVFSAQKPSRSFVIRRDVGALAKAREAASS